VTTLVDQLGQGYVNYAEYVVSQELGRCRPAYNAYFAAINTVCYLGKVIS